MFVRRLCFNHSIRVKSVFKSKRFFNSSSIISSSATGGEVGGEGGEREGQNQFLLDDSDYESIRKGEPFPDDQNPNLKGWELLVKRARDIVDSVSDKEFNKILHIYCNTDFVKELGESSNYSISGCTDNTEDYESTKDLKQYGDSVKLVDFTKRLPYNFHEFHIAVSLPHPTRHISSSALVSVSDFVRVVNEDGYGIFGCPSKVWREKNLWGQFEKEEKKGALRLVGIFSTEIDESKCLYYLAIIRGGGG